MLRRNFHLIILCQLLALLSTATAYDVPGYTPSQIIPFKTTENSSGGAVTLNLHVFTPPGHQASDSRPAIVFFFGGGWSSGSASHFHPQCDYLASRGMVAISAEYRVRSFHGTSPQECVKDGKSAIRYLRANAATLGIDPDRIAAGGGSAGGHVAAATALLSSYEEPGENLSISSKPNALVLYNPVADNGPGGYGHNTVQAYWQTISPLHNITASAPPTAFFLGTNDHLVPVSVGEAYRSAMEAVGSRCDLHLYQNQPHSFFNFDVPDDNSGPFYGYQDTLYKTDEFLISLGYLSERPDTRAPATGWTTLSGDAGFVGSTAATASPITTDAKDDCIAATFDPITLTDGGFIRLTGSVTFDAPLTGDSFRLGLFNGTASTGIWAGAPTTTATQLAVQSGPTLNHPFETSAATTLGPIPAANASVPANQPIEFSLMVARNGNRLDLAVSFSNGNTYRSSQNLLNQALSTPTFDRAAFLLGAELTATQASFSNIAITHGQALPSAGTPPTLPPSPPINYIDATDGPTGNTFKTGSTSADVSWVGPDDQGVSNTQWNKRLTVEGNSNTIFQGSISTNTLPELTTRITGLADGTYAIWAFYWDQVDSATQNWVLSAGLTTGALTAYSSPGHPTVAGTTKTSVTNAAELIFNTAVSVQAGWNGTKYLRELFGINLGRVTVANGAPVDVFIDNSLTTGGNNRAWYDGVGHQLITPANTFANWIAGFPETEGHQGLNDDPDGDGISNGLENLFGTNPGVASHGIVAASAAPAAGTFTFTHPFNPSPAVDLTATYQWSADLATFTNGGQTFQGSTVTFTSSPPANGLLTITATVTGAQLDKLFIRATVLEN